MGMNGFGNGFGIDIGIGGIGFRHNNDGNNGINGNNNGSVMGGGGGGAKTGGLYNSQNNKLKQKFHNEYNPNCYESSLKSTKFEMTNNRLRNSNNTNNMNSKIDSISKGKGKKCSKIDCGDSIANVGNVNGRESNMYNILGCDHFYNYSMRFDLMII